ncbi:MAG: hypothetical protein LDL33_08270 [Desulfomonile sp.]|nr:hypothetical protein [Desulfomonile sp.]
MLRLMLFLVLTSGLVASWLPCFGQGLPICFPPPFSTVKPCEPKPSVKPITRTVEVQVPVPCPPPVCAVPAPCPPNHCGPPPCPPPPPSRPVQVRVEVVVRPEKPKPCDQPKIVCENPPVFEPYFYEAAGIIRSLIVAPLALGEMLMGHGGPAARIVPPCPPFVGACLPSLKPRSTPLSAGGLSASHAVAPPTSGPIHAQARPSNAPFPK